jgi:hypothetical protein
MAEAPVQALLLAVLSPAVLVPAAVLLESSVMRYSMSFQTACRGRAWILQGLVQGLARGDRPADGRRVESGVGARD